MKMPVDEAPAGPEIDAAVAKALGIERGECEANATSTKGFSISEDRRLWSWSFNCRWCRGEIKNDVAGSCPKYPFLPYSTDIAAAWELLEELRKKLPPVTIYQLDGWKNHYWTCWIDRDGANHRADAETAPLAICRAFLKANGIEHIEVPE